MLLLCLTAAAQSVPAQFKGSDATLYANAVKSYEANRLTEARAAFKKLSQRYPNAADPYYYLGLIAVRRDDNAGAIKHYFTKLLQVNPDYKEPRAHYYMGVVDYSYGRYRQAISRFERFNDMAAAAPSAENDALREEAANYLRWCRFLADGYEHQVPFAPRMVKGASSKYSELLPYLTVDGRELWYLRALPRRREYTIYVKELNEFIPTLHVSYRDNDSTFSSGREMAFPFNQTDNEGGVTLTADRRHLYNSVLTTTEDGYANCDIYHSTCEAGIWSPLEKAGATINGEHSWESQPSVSPDGSILYFASNRSGGAGGTDIWRCRRLPNGDWGRAENLGTTVNTPGNEKCPFIHADGHTLYFGSNGWEGFGGYDMYHIDLENEDIERPTNMGMPINTDGDDICFGVTADGLQAYYAARPTDYRGAGGADIFFFDLYPEARPEAMKMFEGIALCGGTADAPKPAGGTLTVHRFGVPPARYIIDSTDGRIAALLSMDHNNLVVFQTKGCNPVVLYYSRDAVRAAKGAVMDTLRANLTDKNLPITLRPSCFLKGDGAKDEALSHEGRKVMEAYAQFLLENPTLKVVVSAPRKGQAQAIQQCLLESQLRPDRIKLSPSSTQQARLTICR